MASARTPIANKQPASFFVLTKPSTARQAHDMEKKPQGPGRSPGPGRPSKSSVRVCVKLSPESVRLLRMVPSGSKSAVVDAAIIEALADSGEGQREVDQ